MSARTGLASAMADAIPGVRDERAVLTWRYDPWREHPVTASTAAVLALAMCVLIASLREPLLLTLALSVLCVASFSPAVTPVECRVGADDLARRGLLGWERRPWSAIRRLVPLPEGVLASPYATRHWLEGMRGLVLPLPAAQRVELLAALEAQFASHAD